MTETKKKKMIGNSNKFLILFFCNFNHNGDSSCGNRGTVLPHSFPSPIFIIDEMKWMKATIKLKAISAMAG